VRLTWRIALYQLFYYYTLKVSIFFFNNFL